MSISVRVPIEVDVTYINKTWGSFKKKQSSNVRHYVIGFYRRSIANMPCHAIIKSIPNNFQETVSKAVIETIGKGATLYAHEKILPISLSKFYDIHDLKVSENEFIRGDIHINNVNNLWKSLRRLIKQEHVQVSQKHLQLYCNEVAWRTNNNHLTPAQRFEKMIGLSGIAGHQTYQDLIK